MSLSKNFGILTKKYALIIPGFKWNPSIPFNNSNSNNDNDRNETSLTRQTNQFNLFLVIKYEIKMHHQKQRATMAPLHKPGLAPNPGQLDSLSEDFWAFTQTRDDFCRSFLNPARVSLLVVLTRAGYWVHVNDLRD